MLTKICKIANFNENVVLFVLARGHSDSASYLTCAFNGSTLDAAIYYGHVEDGTTSMVSFKMRVCACLASNFCE